MSCAYSPSIPSPFHRLSDRQILPGPIPGHADELISPVLNPHTQKWNGFVINAIGPDGRYIPVVPSTNGQDQRLEVATQDNPIQNEANNTAYRVVDIWRKRDGVIYVAREYFDYSSYGFIKIGNTLVDKKDSKAMNAADIRWRKESQCSPLTKIVSLILLCTFIYFFVSKPAKC